MVLSRALFTFVTLDCPSEFGEIDVLRFFEVGKLQSRTRNFFCSVHFKNTFANKGIQYRQTFLLFSLNSNFFLDTAWSKLCYKISCGERAVFSINFLKACTSTNPLLSIDFKLSLEVNVLIFPGYNFFYHDRSFLNIDSESKNLHTQTVGELPRLYSYSIFMTVLRSTGESNPPL